MTTITSAGTLNYDPLKDGFYNSYSHMKSKHRIQYDTNLYENIGINVMLSMFEWDDEIFRPKLLDLILHDMGHGALIATDTARYTPVVVDFVGGDRYADGYFKNAVCFDFAGKEYRFSDWRDNEDILVFFNNNIDTYDTFISKYASMLAEVDASLNSNVIFSRLKPVPVADDNETKAKIDTILNDVLTGKIKTIVTGNGARALLNPSGTMIDTLDLTHVEDSKYLQYLLHTYDNLISRLFFSMGLSIMDNGKQAQITNDELNKGKAGAIAITDAWYRARLDGFEDAKYKTGKDFYFAYSELWKSEIAKTETDENGDLIADEVQETETETQDNGEGDAENV